VTGEEGEAGLGGGGDQATGAATGTGGAATGTGGAGTGGGLAATGAGLRAGVTGTDAVVYVRPIKSAGGLAGGLGSRGAAAACLRSRGNLVRLSQRLPARATGFSLGAAGLSQDPVTSAVGEGDGRL
jgi:hypothetical protein